ncbi:MAG: Asp-tRNA(Asn)/Glu-tRNA(Gln) amidotransferase subunit GatC [Actinobacteria bacterium]|nr:Asp-tRNA(Asn)/Glu-tRNA(Gln) amidotransferase subunit GatC [Actinomycetota bacterium]
MDINLCFCRCLRVSNYRSARRIRVVAEKISQETVIKVSRLARLSLNTDEAEKMTAQLAGMLEHFRDIDALDLADVEPMTQPYPLKNVLREDVIAPSLDRDEVLGQAPTAESGRFRVPPTIGFDV